MRIISFIIGLVLFNFTALLHAADDMPDFSGTATIDFLLERAISAKLISGGVMVVGNHSGILASSARGRLDDRPDAPLLDSRTIFDLASLTKVIATAPAVMKLLDQGRITLNDPLSLWFPELKGTEHENTTILHLLTHTSGLTDFDVSAEHPMQTAIQRVAGEKNRQGAGNVFKYADINFILLGELVHRVSGKPLDAYCRDELYAPLTTAETMFLPGAEIAGRVAPTLGNSCGLVQDRNARNLGGVAGHAGLFSSAQDLARFARMMLDGGELDGKRILSADAVKLMTAPFSCSNSATLRGLGWDIHSAFSSPKGRLFSGVSFGHTGYSGSSIWIDPGQDLFVILLVNRLNYQDVRAINRLRSDISTIIVAEYAKAGSLQCPVIPPAVARIPAVPLPPPVHTSQPAQHETRLVAALSEKHTKAYRQNAKKGGKKHRHKSASRTNRA